MPGKHILAFEADPLYAGMLNDALSSRGYRIDIVGDGVEGLDKAAAEPPDLIYLCVELPRISGFSICNKLKKSNALKDIPLIITSSEATDETFDKHKKLKGHADEYMHKPFTAEEIGAAADSLLDGSDDDGSVEEIVEEDAMEDMVVEDDESVMLESGSDIGGLDDLEDVEADDAEPKGIDSDINALADSAFDHLELKTNPPQDATLERPSVSVVVQTMDDEPEDTGRRRESSERISVIPTDATERLKVKNEELLKKVEVLEKQLIAASSAKKSTVSSSEFLDLREALSKKDRELLDLKDVVNGKEKEVLNLKDKLTGLERQKADLEDKNIDALKQINQIEQNLETLNVEHEHLKRKSADQERQIQELEEHVTILAGSLEDEKSGREADVRNEKEAAAKAVEEQRERMEREANERRESELKQKQHEHDTAVASLISSMTSDKEHALSSLRDEHAKTVESMNKERADKESELQKEIAARKGDIERLEGDKAGLESELSKTRESLADTAKQLEVTQQSLRETGGYLDAEKREHEGTRGVLADTKQKLEEQIARGDGLDNTVAELKSEISNLNDEIGSLNDLISGNEEIIEKAKKAVAIAGQLLGDLESISEMEEGDEEDREADE